MGASAGRVLIQAGGAVSLLGNVALAVILGATDHVTTWGLLAPLLVTGMGMGLFIVPVFDTIIAAVTDAETGSASGVLNAIQQLGGAIGVAVLGTVFFTVLGHDGFGPALPHHVVGGGVPGADAGSRRCCLRGHARPRMSPRMLMRTSVDSSQRRALAPA